MTRSVRGEWKLPRPRRNPRCFRDFASTRCVPFPREHERRMRWLGRTEFLTLTIRNEPRLEAQTHNESEMGSSPSAYRSALENVLDTARHCHRAGRSLEEEEPKMNR